MVTPGGIITTIAEPHPRTNGGLRQAGDRHRGRARGAEHDRDLAKEHMIVGDLYQSTSSGRITGSGRFGDTQASTRAQPPIFQADVCFANLDRSRCLAPRTSSSSPIVSPNACMHGATTAPSPSSRGRARSERFAMERLPPSRRYPLRRAWPSATTVISSSR